ncbi:MAG: alanine--tRNA ligase [Rhodobacter sp.]|nr:alanine--tRNA ligase [Rhodobacter sp.]
MTSLNDIRTTFLDYFRRNGHEIVPSSPLVPRNDPTLMFVNSGMVQFKNLFTGIERRAYSRAATAQKCVRAGGKHNDLDNVGYTARHHTFFEMLGNFSFGDYFKDEAIPLAWGLLTDEFGIDSGRLSVTVYHTDDEAADIWKKVGVPEDRIIRIATHDNFWQMGPTGPCGPCTEIFYDHGEHIPGGPPGGPDEDGDRFVEIWNIVFMQNERFEDGSMVDLDIQSIDTGMGLERVGALLQGRHDNYDTDTMRALIEASANVIGSDPYGPGNAHHRVIADHLRSMAFLVADGVTPSNEGRGNVLRRIMRRAMRHAHLAGARDPVMHRLVPTLVDEMGRAYPELVRALPMIEEALGMEETRFLKTLERGLRLLDDEVFRLPDGADLPGVSAFRLYDTYGFPLDLTLDALRERGRGVDVAGFDAEMKRQRAEARKSWSGVGDWGNSAIWFDLLEAHGATEFLGYGTETAEGQVAAIVTGEKNVEAIRERETGWIVVNQTPFYGEAGGQVSDHGSIRTVSGDSGQRCHCAVRDVQRFADGRIFAHEVAVMSGCLRLGDAVSLTVDHERRTAIRANHSATHLLHEALRRTLGDHVAQRGSLNGPDRLRFDFSHRKALSDGELMAVENEVNAHIRRNSPVLTRIMTLDDARSIGAQALFGEKYGDDVRVVSMGGSAEGKGADGNTYSIELCGGTHVERTGDIGLCVLLGDSASSAGVRRIEALTGRPALAHMHSLAARVGELSDMLRTGSSDLVDRVRSLVDERKRLSSEVAKLRRDLAMAGQGGDAGVGGTSRSVAGTEFLAQVLKGVSGKDLPGLIDEHKARIGTGVILLIADGDGKAAVAAGVTGDLTERFSAVEIVRAAVPELGGRGGGGRRDMAQGGGKTAERAAAAIEAVETLLKGVER